MQPIELGPNAPDTFYRGAGRISRFRGTAFDERPEDWIGSTTARFDHSPAGLSDLADGRRLIDAVAAEPIAWLGREHVGRFGSNPALLVKLLDAGQRLPLHVHPDRGFATDHLATPFGKTEAWVVLEAPPEATVHLGFGRDISSGELESWVRAQDVDALLAATNEVPVRAGDALLCPAGLPHAIGSGILLLELQEPTDFSVLLEWRDFPLTIENATLQLPLELALRCVDRRRCDDARIATLRGANSIGTLLPAEADEFFIAERLTDGASLPESFSILVVTAGVGELRPAPGTPMALRAGQTILIPHAAGPCVLAGPVTAVNCRPARTH